MKDLGPTNDAAYIEALQIAIPPAVEPNGLGNRRCLLWDDASIDEILVFPDDRLMAIDALAIVIENEVRRLKTDIAAQGGTDGPSAA